MENLERYLGHFPLREKDDFEKLQALVIERQKNCQLKQTEKARLDEELSVISKTNTACVFLFFNERNRLANHRPCKSVRKTFFAVAQE